jgi:hypothetical protein
MVKTYIEESQPRDSDVVSGRGGRSNHHPGNKACWLVILSRRPPYKACETPAKKNEIAQGVVDFVHQQGGRYVQLDTDNGRWFILPDAVALEKAKQGLRDDHVPKWVTGEAAGKKKPPATKKVATKKRSEVPREKGPSAAVQQEQTDQTTPALSALPTLQSFGMNQSNALSVSLSLSIDGLLSLGSTSNSFAGAGPSYGAKGLLPASVGRSVGVSWAGQSATRSATTQSKDDWGDMFTSALSAR